MKIEVSKLAWNQLESEEVDKVSLDAVWLDLLGMKADKLTVTVYKFKIKGALFEGWFW